MGQWYSSDPHVHLKPTATGSWRLRVARDPSLECIVAENRACQGHVIGASGVSIHLTTQFRLVSAARSVLPIASWLHMSWLVKVPGLHGISQPAERALSDVSLPPARQAAAGCPLQREDNDRSQNASQMLRGEAHYGAHCRSCMCKRRSLQALFGPTKRACQHRPLQSKGRRPRLKMQGVWCGAPIFCWKPRSSSRSASSRTSQCSGLTSKDAVFCRWSSSRLRMPSLRCTAVKLGNT